MRFYCTLLLACIAQWALAQQSTGSLRYEAEQGNAEAAIMLAERYSMGTWDTQINNDSAQIYLEKAYALGNGDAAYLIGLNYLHGLGVSRNKKEAITWLERAADKGNAEALNAMYKAYASGVSIFEEVQFSIPKDEQKAFELAQKAAGLNDAEAITHCAYAYHTGTGASQNDTLAVEWMHKAASLGHAPAQQQLAHWYFRGGIVFETDFDKAAVYYDMLVKNPKSDIDQITIGKVGLHECRQWKRISVNLHWSLLLPDPLMPPQLYVQP